ncbi:MAG: hypothetical protein HYV47_04105 [Candidatus Nealsonbacteria bacterium]|nr:hypothetical protein [Candidatus Nealsonbacteria bacterium]
MVISSGDLEKGKNIILAELAGERSCDQTHLCIFSSRENIPKECWGHCQYIIFFRQSFESDSPAFYGEFLRICDTARKMHTYLALKMEESNSSPMAAQAKWEIDQLPKFINLALVALYPIFLSNDSQFPFLISAEITEERKYFSASQAEIDGIKGEMRLFHALWPDQVCEMSRFLGLNDSYLPDIFFLIKLFLCGIRKAEIGEI